MARLCTAVDKMLPLSLHHGMLLFAHGPANIVCLAKGEACQLPEDLHHLLLVDDASVGHIQDMRQLRCLVLGLIRLMTVMQVGRDGIHRSRTIQADQSDDIFQTMGLQTHQDLLHAGGFQLEYTLGFSLAEHLIGLGVIVVQLLHREARLPFLHSSFCVPD